MSEEDCCLFIETFGLTIRQQAVAIDGQVEKHSKNNTASRSVALKLKIKLSELCITFLYYYVCGTVRSGVDLD